MCVCDLTAACTYRIAFGPRAGQKVFTLQGAMPPDVERAQDLCADQQGNSAARCGALRCQRAPAAGTTVPLRHPTSAGQRTRADQQRGAGSAGNRIFKRYVLSLLGRIRPLRADLLGSIGLAIARLAATAPPCDTKAVATSGKPSSFVALTGLCPRQAQPVPDPRASGRLHAACSKPPRVGAPGLCPGLEPKVRADPLFSPAPTGWGR